MNKSKFQKAIVSRPLFVVRCLLSVVCCPLFVVCCLLSVVFLSCTKNDYSSYCPTWKGFTYKTGSYPNYVNGGVGSNITLNAGDSIHITAHQDKKGRLINATYYTWTLCYDTLDTNGVRVHATKSIDLHTNYDGYANGSDDPVCHMLLPANTLSTAGERYCIKFVARYSYSGQGVTIETGSIVDNTSYNGRITPQSGATGGGAAGTFYFYANGVTPP